MNLKDGELYVDRSGVMYVADLQRFLDAQGVAPPDLLDQVSAAAERGGAGWGGAGRGGAGLGVVGWGGVGRAGWGVGRQVWWLHSGGAVVVVVVVVVCVFARARARACVCVCVV